MKEINLGFLFKVLKMNKASINDMLLIPEFKNAVCQQCEIGTHISDELLYKLISEISFKKFSENDVNFPKRKSKIVLRALSEVVYGDRHAWEMDFERFLMTKD